jgi:predicted SnoaL-like aldol condensation-catalyzing enzyme
MSKQVALNRKDMATDFLRMASSGQVRDAYRRYIASDFRHHNPNFAGDAQSLMIAMEENAAQNPNKVFEVQHVLEDGDLVAVHGKVTLKPHERAIALVHVFKFKDDRVTELWDVGQPEPETSPNRYGMF